MDTNTDPVLYKMGELAGRMTGVEQRLDRHESTVSAALASFSRQIESFAAETRSCYNQLSQQIEGLRSKLDRQEGARAQKAEDKDAADKEKHEAQEKFFTKKNIEIAQWLLLVTAAGVVVGILGQAHFHFFMLTNH